MENDKKGFVYIAGAGIGRENCSVKVMKLISEADVILYDDLIDKELLDESRTDAVRIYVGKRRGAHSMAQDEIHELLRTHAVQGRTVLRLKSGDPFVFGRGGEECLFLREQGIPFEVIPGITSAIAVPEHLGIPVTHRELSRSVTVITGHTSKGSVLDEELEKYAALDGTLVFLMGLSALKDIAEGLVRHGMDSFTPAAVISSGYDVAEHCIRGTLSDIYDKADKDERIVSPAVIVIGKTTALDLKSDRGTKMIKLTGTSDFVSRSVKQLSALLPGMSFLECPHIALRETEGPEITTDGYTHIIFMGRHGADYFFKKMSETGEDIRSLHDKKIVTIGPSTAAYLRERYMLNTDLIPEKHTSDGLVTLLTGSMTSSDKACIIRAAGGNDVLKTGLDKTHISFTELSMYETTTDERYINTIKDDGFDYITFGSSEGVRRYFESGGSIPEGAVALCIGAYTAEMLGRYFDGRILTSVSSDISEFATLIGGKA